MAARMNGSRLVLGAMLVLTSACLSSSGSGGGQPNGNPSRALLDALGGTVVSPDGVLTVTIPPGALTAPTEVVIQPITNTAPQGQGSAYRIGPADLVLALPATLAFTNVTGQPIGNLTLVSQFSFGWMRVASTPDLVANRLSVSADAFGLTDWAVALSGPNVGKDLVGNFTLITTVDVPFTATGNLSLIFAGADAAGAYFFPGGNLTISSPVTIGAQQCVPAGTQGASAPVSNTALEEVRNNPDRLLWAINAYWPLSCPDGSKELVSTQFDTLGINLHRCSRAYQGVPTVAADRLQCDAANGCAYVIDCGPRGVARATWSFATCPAGDACASAIPCHGAAMSCSSGFPVCLDTGALPDGTDCSTAALPGHVCSAGTCVVCNVGDACTPPGACVAWAISSCSTGPACSATTVSLPDGLACGAGSTCNAGACVPSRTVTGARLVTHWLDDGTTVATPVADVNPLPGNAAAAVSALVPAGTGWIQYPGTFAADGTYQIPGVPLGPYTLVLVDGDGTFRAVETSQSVVDLGYDVLGRPNAQKALLATPVTLDLSGLGPWGATDVLQMVSWGAGIRDVPASGASLAPGATTGSVIRDWAASPALELLAPGDTLVVNQIAMGTATLPVGTLDYLAAGNSASLTGVDMADGVATSLAANMAPPPTTGTLSVDWSVTGFEALLASMGPAGTAALSHSLVVGATPGSLSTPDPAGGPPEIVRMEVAPGSPDVLVASPISYGQFLPVAPSANPWVEWRAATFTVQKGYSADLTAIPYLALASAGQRVTMATANAQRATPAVTPVIAPRWNGVLDALVDQAAVTTTPALSWTAPTVGGSSYTVSIWRLGTTAIVPPTSTATLVASWVTSGTSVRVPPNLLVAGTSYFARIDVRARTSDGFDGAPFRSRDLTGWASTLTATFTP